MEDLETLISSYRNYLICKTLGETGKETRREILNQAESERLSFLRDIPGWIQNQARRLLHPAQAIVTLIQLISCRHERRTK